jgi:hypothetical protein
VSTQRSRSRSKKHKPSAVRKTLRLLGGCALSGVGLALTLLAPGSAAHGASVGVDSVGKGRRRPVPCPNAMVDVLRAASVNDLPNCPS